MIDRSDTQWYKDAIIYQMHVKSFHDANIDGIGDFQGATSKLDYIRDLGATAIWLMPFYPSPLRDDGYDISNYKGINPAYGTLRDFRRFVREAHERDLRVITELVINHTSDQHSWFQKARAAPAGSRARNYYVWSDSDKKYEAARIIFLDVESSNWTWDPGAKAYYWHRFYSHQPDLNFDNPRVLEAILSVMRYWLDMGVDGLRLDAIPYLIEREGTNCENLPETHDVIRKLRAALDARYPDRMLLAEANQWPEETAPYFGAGDECQCAFHFPLMPRIYMALAQEDRHPVTDIMRQTPDIPEGCQWTIFLRNHDELTLEMVTAKERDYLWSFYAADPRARVNLGIRRRLAPLVENDRRKMELLNSLLLSMPGTPVIYYGDELGMGDNIYLGDRDSVRTPMQWSPDRNGGFSRSDPAKLFLPAIQDPIYGFPGTNVEAQQRSPESLLNWMKRMLAVRRNYKAFGRGTLRFVSSENRKVLSYVRETEDEHLLCVHNLSRAPQAVELSLSEFRGYRITEVTGGAVFPRIGDLSYLLTLPAYGFYWFSLTPDKEVSAPAAPPTTDSLFTLVLSSRMDSILEGRELTALEQRILPTFIARRRWFAGKHDAITKVHLSDYAVLSAKAGPEQLLLIQLDVSLSGGAQQQYFVPLVVDPARQEEAVMPYAVANVRRGPNLGLLYGAGASPQFALALVDAMRAEREVSTAKGGTVTFHASPRLAEYDDVDPSAVQRINNEQSNTSIALADRMVLKLIRRPAPGINPEIEIGTFLTEIAHFDGVPQLLGYVEQRSAAGIPATIAVLQQFVQNQGDGWKLTLGALERGLEETAMMKDEAATALDPNLSPFLPYIEILGRRTAQLHLALATPTDDPAFSIDHVSEYDIATSDFATLTQTTFDMLRERRENLAEAGRPEIDRLLARREECLSAVVALLEARWGRAKIRIHGDLHLGQILVVQNDLRIIDFEGEPTRSLEHRRAKSSPIKDVAGMLRSFDYARATALRDLLPRLPDPQADRLRHAADLWRKISSDTFLRSYRATVLGSVIDDLDDASFNRVLQGFLLEKAIYEISYELSNRPEWVSVPVGGVLKILDGSAG